jgi:hypothetical protein
MHVKTEVGRGLIERLNLTRDEKDVTLGGTSPG